MKSLNGKIAVVTGAGSGIGQATALALAAQGARVVVTDISESTAQTTADLIRSQSQSAEAYKLDVADYAQMQAVATRVQQDIGVPSIVVNNAGIAVAGSLLDCSLENWEKVVSINLMGVVHGCKAFLPAMVKSNSPGHIVNIASMAGFSGVAKLGAYTATKFAIVGFSESLRAEMSAHQIGVSAICPGLISTNIVSAGIFESSEVDVEEKRRAINALYSRRNYTPDRVAKVILKAIRKNRAVVPVTTEAWLVYYSKRWIPWLPRWLAGKDFL